MHPQRSRQRGRGGAFVFKAPAGAKQISLEELKAIKDMNEFPSNFILGGR